MTDNTPLLATWRALPWYQKHNAIMAWLAGGLVFGGITLVPIAIIGLRNPVYLRPGRKDTTLRKWGWGAKVGACFLAGLWLYVVIGALVFGLP